MPHRAILPLALIHILILTIATSVDVRATEPTIEVLLDPPEEFISGRTTRVGIQLDHLPAPTSAGTQTSGFVLNASGEPCPGAEVLIVNHNRPHYADFKLIADATTNEEGRFDITHRPWYGEFRIGAFAPGHGYAALEGIRPATTLFTLQLPRETILTGRVLNAAGAPQPGAMVTYETFGASTFKAYMADQRHGRVASTGADGHFRIAGVEAVDPQHTIITAVLGDLTAQARMDIQSGTINRVLLQLPAMATLNGTITDASSGEPIEGATIQRVLDNVAAPAAVTDASGRYVIDSLTAGPVALIIRADGYAFRGSVADPVLAARLETGASQTVDLTLERQSPIHVSLVDSEGNPSPHALSCIVTGQNFETFPGHGTDTTPDDRGFDDNKQLRILGLAPHQGVRLQITTHDLVPPSHTRRTRDYFVPVHAGPDPGVHKVDVVVDDSLLASVSGTVVDVNGHPLSQGHVEISTPGFMSGSPLDDDGRFEITHLLPGTYYVRYRHSKEVYHDVSPTFALSAGDNKTDVQIIATALARSLKDDSIPPEYRIEGVVDLTHLTIREPEPPKEEPGKSYPLFHDASYGGSLPGIVQPTPGPRTYGRLEGWARGHRSSHHHEERYRVNAKEFPFLLDARRFHGGGPVSVYGTFNNMTTVVLEDVAVPSRDLRIVPEPEGKVEGMVLDAATGEPVERFEVHTYPPWRKGNHERIRCEDGAYTINGLGAMEMEFLILAPGYVHSPRMTASAAPGTTVTIPPIELHGGLAIPGRVVNEDGDPIPNSGIMVSDAYATGRITLARAVSDNAGRFVLEGLQTGVGYLQVSADGYFGKEGERFVITPDLAETGMTITLERKSGLLIAVRDNRGYKFSDAEAYLVDIVTGEIISERIPVNQWGYLQLEGIEPGDYIVRIMATDPSVDPVERKVTVEDGRREKITIDMPRRPQPEGTPVPLLHSSYIEEFDSLPMFSSAYDAGLRSPAEWEIRDDDDRGRFLVTSQEGFSSSVRVIQFDVPQETHLEISAMMRVPHLPADSLVEFSYRPGQLTAEDFVKYAGEWTTIKRFTGESAGNGNQWQQYSTTVATRQFTQITVGLKIGSSGDGLPPVGWDRLVVR